MATALCDRRTTACGSCRLLPALSDLWKHDLNSAGNRPCQTHDVPHLPAGGDSTVAPLHHAVKLDTEALGELLPRQTGELCEPLQPLAEVFREGRRAATPILFLLFIVLPPFYPYPPVPAGHTHPRQMAACGHIPGRGAHEPLLPAVVALQYRSVTQLRDTPLVCKPTDQPGRVRRYSASGKQSVHQAINPVAVSATSRSGRPTGFARPKPVDGGICDNRTPAPTAFPLYVPPDRHSPAAISGVTDLPVPHHRQGPQCQRGAANKRFLPSDDDISNLLSLPRRILSIENTNNSSHVAGSGG